MIIENIVTHCDHHKVFYEDICADDLINDVMDIFLHRDYSTGIPDIIVQMVSNALYMSIYIYQQSTAGKIQVIKQSARVGWKKVCLQYLHIILHPLGNHWYA